MQSLCARRAKRNYPTVLSCMVRSRSFLYHGIFYLANHSFPVMKPCAHVTCKTCTDSLVRPAKQCVVCDKQLKEKDIIELKREGEVFFIPANFL
jgi:hypothetical protein